LADEQPQKELLQEFSDGGGAGQQTPKHVPSEVAPQQPYLQPA